jgi:hypothetical protein
MLGMHIQKATWHHPKKHNIQFQETSFKKEKERATKIKIIVKQQKQTKQKGGGGDEGILLNNVHKKSDDEISYHP